MVPHDNIFVTESFPLQRGSQIILQEIALLFRGVNARLPGLGGHGLVLDRDSPNGHSFGFVGLDELHIIIGPGLGIAGQQLAAPQHVFVVFHEGGGTPRTGIEHQGSPGGFRGPLDQRNPDLPVMVNVKSGQRRVPLLNIGIAAAAEITAVNGGPHQRVADALLPVVVSRKELLLFFERKAGKHLGAGIGDGSPDAQKFLEGNRGIYEDTNLGFLRLLCRGKRKRSRGGQPQITAVGCRVNFHTLAFGRIGHSLLLFHSVLCATHQKKRRKNIKHILAHEISLLVKEI